MPIGAQPRVARWHLFTFRVTTHHAEAHDRGSNSATTNGVRIQAAVGERPEGSEGRTQREPASHRERHASRREPYRFVHEQQQKKSIQALGLASRRAWAIRAGVSPALLSLILAGHKPLTPRTRRLLALAAGVCDEDVAALLASTRSPR